ncbi:hypothetical protein [Sphingobacterium kyonggiense]
MRPVTHIRRYADGQVRMSGHRGEGYIDKVQTSPMGKWGQGRPAEQQANG